MKEIEILNSLQESIVSAEEKVKSFIFPDGEIFKSKGNKHTVDMYFASNVFDDLNLDTDGRLKASLRLRQKGDDAYITYKYDHFNDHKKWMYSDESETKIQDIKVINHILKALHFENLVTIDNQKFCYESNKYEIVLEDVVGLGRFVEIEYISNVEIDEGKINNIRNEMLSVIASIGLSIGEEMNAGKPELMLKKVASLKN